MCKDIDLGAYLDGVSLVYDTYYYGNYCYKLRVDKSRVLDKGMLDIVGFKFYVTLDTDKAKHILELEYKGKDLSIWCFSGSNVLEKYANVYKLINLKGKYYVIHNYLNLSRKKLLDYLKGILDGACIQDIIGVYKALSLLVREDFNNYYFISKDEKSIDMLIYSKNGKFKGLKLLEIINANKVSSKYECLDLCEDDFRSIYIDKVTLLEVTG